MHPAPRATHDPAHGAGGPGRGRAARWAAPAAAVLVALLHAAALGDGPGPTYGDDWALYLLHARSLVEGRPYADTGFLVNPLNPWFSPQRYPPGFPLLLAPVYAAAGLDFRALKGVVVLGLAGALLLLARLARRELPPAAAAGVVLLAGLHPFVWSFRDDLLPDLPFTSLCLLALALAERAAAAGPRPAERAAWCAAAAAAVAAAVATRSIGVVLVPALAVALLLRARRPGRALLAGGAAGAALIAALLALTPAGSAYVGQLRGLAAVYGAPVLLPGPERARSAGFALAKLWANGGWETGAKAVALGTLLLAALGLAPRLRRPSAHEVFFVAYVCAVLLWPAADPRYFLPVLPLYVLYGVLGARRAWGAGGRPARAAVAVAAMAVAATLAGRHASLAASPPGDGRPGAEATALYRHLRGHTPAGARFMAARPRALALYARRAAMPPPRRETPDSASLALLERAGIGYVVVRAGTDEARPLVERNPLRFRRVYANREYQLFRTLPPPPRPVRAAGT
jgi:4-amino-4-deoxy-L-arabinose transferase-like glycosyltransferase